MQKRFHDIGWSDEKMCRGRSKEGTEKHRSHRRPAWREVTDQMPEDSGEVGGRGKDLKERLAVAERSHVTPSERMSLEDKPPDSLEV